MLRISVEDRGAAIQLKLEGQLKSIWVAELEHCWRSQSAAAPRRDIVVDLTRTDFVDLTGKYLLTLMHHRGVKFIARSPLMKGLLAEIALTEKELNQQPTTGGQKE
jgi:aryl-alcohol dehydrogenase-like predicted oxidoreductase